ncbi:MAG: toast rack family protein [Anaerosomatales bacterium]|nr:toast rack family protein [Anaerosomatales bacterium]
MERIVKIGLVAALAGALLVTSGCVRVELPDPELIGDTVTVEREGAERAEVSLDMGAGKLEVTSGAVDLMEADFEYTRDRWEPDVSYDVDGDTGTLEVRTPRVPDFSFGSNDRYVWRLVLAEDMPLELAVNLGAGQADLDLGGLMLSELTVDMGAGDTTVDLSGEPTMDLDAEINAGAGKLTLYVPRDAGVRVVGYKDGVGSYRADGFEIDGDALVNDAYGEGGFTYDIVLRRGVGEVVIEMVD